MPALERQITPGVAAEQGAFQKLDAMSMGGEAAAAMLVMGADPVVKAVLRPGGFG